MTKISILTPTYNRKHLLNKLYLSLCNQDCMDFEWVIVDDGSDDGTKEYVETLCSLNIISIRYLYKENGGKHTALNLGINNINNPLIFIVDSDDYLTTDAISTILKTYERFRQETDLCGFSFLRAKANGELLCDNEVPQDGMKETYVECRVNGGIGGDMAEVWYTSCLKEYPFPEFSGERFLGEDVIWVQMSGRYYIRFFNKVIYISEYLEDGLTKNRRIHNISSPKGCLMRAEIFLNAKINFSVLIKSMLQYQIYGRLANVKQRQLFKNTQKKFMFVLLLIPAQLIAYNWKNKYRK